MYLLRTCYLKRRRAGKPTYILVFLCGFIIPIYLHQNLYSTRSLAQHFIYNLPFGELNGENEISGKLGYLKGIINDTYPNYYELNITSTQPTFTKWRSHQYYLNGLSELPALFRKWRETTDSQCQGHFKAFGSVGAMLHDVILDTSKCNGSKGGERLQDVMDQTEDKEFLKFSPGFMTLPCNGTKPSYYFSHMKKKKNHLNSWMTVLVNGSVEDHDAIIDDFTIAITRYEYVNMYHTMTDYYNAFLINAYFNKTPHETHILIVDAHPAGGLDSVWGTLFSSVTRISQIPQRTRFTNLAFGILGYSSPLYVTTQNHGRKLPLIEEFRKFFLMSYDLPLQRPLDCKRLSLLFIWRRDYVAHPRNPKGTVQRKVMNEDELIEKVKLAHPSFTVKGVQLDRFDMLDQLRLIVDTDILIGMHGAGLSHILFMPAGRGLIELLPKYISASSRTHFKKMATEKGIIYTRWANVDHTLERSNFRTIVPVDVINATLSQLMSKMCTRQSPVRHEVENRTVISNQVNTEQRAIDRTMIFKQVNTEH